MVAYIPYRKNLLKVFNFKWNHEEMELDGIFAPSLVLGTHLFVKVSRPRGSEGTFSVFESTCNL